MRCEDLVKGIGGCPAPAVFDGMNRCPYCGIRYDEGVSPLTGVVRTYMSEKKFREMIDEWQSIIDLAPRPERKPMLSTDKVYL